MTHYFTTGNESTCYGCRACEHICPQKAITMKPNEEGFLYPTLDEAICMKCGLCSQVCPNDNVTTVFRKPLKVFAAQYKQQDVLDNSSSGGIFSAVADYVLENNGSVAGCVFDDNFTAIHVVSQDHDTVAKMRGSKYVQSDTKSTYVEIKQRLEQGKFVLFSGTPCQVDGLKLYLCKNYDNLLTIDLICHGVPSPVLLAEYLKLTEQKKGKVTDIKFRNKQRNGWCAQGSVTYLRNGREKTYTISPFNASYYYYYLKNCISRMSCYSCKYSSVQRVGDITIGDYWNINDVLPHVNSKKGISVILVNTNHGKTVVQALKQRIMLFETELSSAVSGNGNLSKPCDLPDSRKNIYKRIKQQGYVVVAKQDCKYQYVVPFLRKHIPKKSRVF